MSSSVLITGVLAALGLLMLSVRSLQMKKMVGPESGRKLVHAGMGTIALSFPWVFHDARPVWFLTVLAGIILVLVRFVPAIAHRYGQILGGVNRSSLGEIFFPLGIVLAFTLAGGNAAAFCGAAAVLAFADTAGALVGTRWGKRRYSLAGSRKSIEGSAAVFVVSAICVISAYALLDVKTWTEILRNGLVIAFAAMLVEAVSWYGLDNLLLPVVVAELMKQ